MGMTAQPDRSIVSGMTAEEKLGRDVFVALAAIGWADGKLDEDEADAIVRTAIEEGLDLDEVAAIEQATKERTDIGAIDIGRMSKADRLFVYAVGAWITRVDGNARGPAERIVPFAVAFVVAWSGRDRD